MQTVVDNNGDSFMQTKLMIYFCFEGSLGDDDSDDEPIVRSVRRKKVPRINRFFYSKKKFKLHTCSISVSTV